MGMTATAAPLLLDSYGNLLRARTFSATAIHTPNPDKPAKTLCGGWVSLLSEWECNGTPEDPCMYAGEHNGNGRHTFDLTVCAGSDPQLCIRCERSAAKRQR